VGSEFRLPGNENHPPNRGGKGRGSGQSCFPVPIRRRSKLSKTVEWIDGAAPAPTPKNARTYKGRLPKVFKTAPVYDEAEVTRALKALLDKAKRHAKRYGRKFKYWRVGVQFTSPSKDGKTYAAHSYETRTSAKTSRPEEEVVPWLSEFFHHKVELGYRPANPLLVNVVVNGFNKKGTPSRRRIRHRNGGLDNVRRRSDSRRKRNKGLSKRKRIRR
jgi:hypothetical protein